MAAGVTIKHKRKAGALVDGELQAGEWGLDVTNSLWYFSINGTTVVPLPGSSNAETLEGEAGAFYRDRANHTGAQAQSTVTNLVTDLAAKAPLASPALTGAPTAPTAAPGTNTTQISTTAFVQAAIAALLNSAPGALDTLDELAAALGDDANFASTVTAALAGKAATSHNHAATDINSGDLATARMQANAAAAVQAGGGGTINNSALIIDGGTL